MKNVGTLEWTYLTGHIWLESQLEVDVIDQLKKKTLGTSQ